MSVTRFAIFWKKSKREISQEENVNGLKKRLKETYESIKSEVEELKAERRRVEADYQEQKEMLEDLQK